MKIAADDLLLSVKPRPLLIKGNGAEFKRLVRGSLTVIAETGSHLSDITSSPGLY